MKTWNRDALRSVTAQLAAHDPVSNLPPVAKAVDDIEDDSSETKSRKSSKSVSQRKHSLQAHRLQYAEAPSPYKHQSKVAQRQLRELREVDERMIHEKCNREQRTRELKFEKMLDEIQTEDEHRVYSGHLIDQHAERNLVLKKKLHSDWNRDVNRRMEYQLFRSANPNQAYEDDLAREKAGTDSDLRNLVAGDDPLKRDLSEAKAEDQFRRTADSIIFGLAPRDQGKVVHGFVTASQEGPSLKELETLWDTRDTSRAVLEPTTWGQLHYQATSYGFFSSSRRNERGSFFTQRRMGLNRHLPADTDGIVCGGTLNGNQMRTTIPGVQNEFSLLTGEWGKRGQTSLYKEPHGPSNGAPGQDHFGFETGMYVTDQEFPLGKRIFKNMH